MGRIQSFLQVCRPLLTGGVSRSPIYFCLHHLKCLWALGCFHPLTFVGDATRGLMGAPPAPVAVSDPFLSSWLHLCLPEQALLLGWVERPRALGYPGWGWGRLDR